MTDIEIAQKNVMIPITEIAEKIEKICGKLFIFLKIYVIICIDIYRTFAN